MSGQDWAETAVKVLATLVCSTGKPDGPAESRHLRARTARLQAHSEWWSGLFQNGRAAPWDDRVAMAVQEAYRLPSRNASYEEDDACIVKAIRIAHAIVSNDASQISTGDRPHLLTRPVLGRSRSDDLGLDRQFMAALELPPPKPDKRSLAAGQTIGVAVAFPWRREGRGDAMPGVAVGREVVGLRGVPEQDAPVRMSLRAGDGSAMIKVRAIEGRLYRPVLSPGSWRPIGVGEFVEACDGRVPWRDHPALDGDPQAGKTYNVLALRDYASPDEPTRPREIDAHAAASEAIRSIGAFVSVKGVVYRPASEPEFLLVTRNYCAKLEWRIGSLASWMPQTTALSPQHRPTMDVLLHDPARGGDGYRVAEFLSSVERACLISSRMSPGRPAFRRGEGIDFTADVGRIIELMRTGEDGLGLSDEFERYTRPSSCAAEALASGGPREVEAAISLLDGTAAMGSHWHPQWEKNSSRKVIAAMAAATIGMLPEWAGLSEDIDSDDAMDIATGFAP